MSRPSDITVVIEHVTPLWVCSDAIRQCYASGNLRDTKPQSVCCGQTTEELEATDWICSSCGLSVTDASMELVVGTKDKNLIDRIGNKMKHESVKNHINFTMSIENISTKTLLALTRHDNGTEFSVESTRFTCKKNKMTHTLTGDREVDVILNNHMLDIKKLRDNGKKCDILAMLLPQAYQYNLRATMSLTALQHFLHLRLAPEAHWDIRNLANVMYDALPEDYKYLFEDYLYNEDRVRVTMTTEEYKMFKELKKGKNV